mmetsp:Transcript_33457/g.73111  ORF Transcript_33457/g.73111 Transcript_33457/m.73111 type:complete len:119 (+) Transcript_33457:601-957(+)
MSLETDTEAADQNFPRTYDQTGPLVVVASLLDLQCDSWEQILRTTAGSSQTCRKLLAQTFGQQTGSVEQAGNQDQHVALVYQQPCLLWLQFVGLPLPGHSRIPRCGQAAAPATPPHRR